MSEQKPSQPDNTLAQHAPGSTGAEPQIQITKRQHFVPQFYLRKFANSENKIEVLDVPQRKILEPRTSKTICYEEFFYGTTTGNPDEVSQQIEKLFQQMEDSVAKQIDPIIEKILDYSEIGDEEKWLIAFLMSMLWIRGPAMREQINRMSGEVMKHVNKVRVSHPSFDRMLDEYDQETGVTTTPAMREKIKKTMAEGDYSLNFNNVSHLQMFDKFQGFANLFAAQDWRVYISKSDKKFTTSDNPITVVIPERNSFYGPSFLERTHYFPLTPELLIMGRYPVKGSGKKLRRKTLFKQDDVAILNLNLTTANQAVQYVYATNRQSLEDILSATKQWEQLKTTLTKSKESKE